MLIPPATLFDFVARLQKKIGRSPKVSGRKGRGLGKKNFCWTASEASGGGDMICRFFYYNKIRQIRKGELQKSEGKTMFITEEEGEMIADEAATWKGTPYKSGGNEKGVGADCSVSTNQIYINAGFYYDYITAESAANIYHLRFGVLAALTSSNRLTGIELGAFFTISGFVFASS